MLVLQLGDRNGYCQDLEEGKFNFPLIHAIRSHHPDGGKVATILKQRTKDYELKRHCLSLMENIGSLEYTKQGLEKYRVEIEKEIKGLGAWW